MDSLSPLYKSPHQHFSARLEMLQIATRLAPLPVLNFLLSQIIRKISTENPTIFARLQGHHHKRFLIAFTNLPIQLVLQPDPLSPQLQAYHKSPPPPHDARMAGSFLTLLGLIDGRYDGDAMFFTRDLHVSGDTEAIVCLRNAIDDMDGGLAEETAAYFGALGLGFLNIVRRLRPED